MENQKTSTTLTTLLIPFQQQIENKIKEALSKIKDKNKLYDACEYALMNGGKRFRPALVFMVAKALGRGVDVSEAALAIEFFHTASLIADDLPCMDNDDERRSLPSLHKVFGEAIALLASYALIAAGYECLVKNAMVLGRSSELAKMSDRIGVLALENASINTGLLGATGGQFLDIYPPNLEVSTLRDVIHKKTVSLFEISFVFGWLFGGGDLEKLEKVKKASAHFGMAFQIADDLGDVEQDAENGRLVNLAAIMGQQEAFKMFHEEMEKFQSLLDELGVHSTEFQDLSNLLIQKAEEVKVL